MYVTHRCIVYMYNAHVYANPAAHTARLLSSRRAACAVCVRAQVLKGLQGVPLDARPLQLALVGVPGSAPAKPQQQATK